MSRPFIYLLTALTAVFPVAGLPFVVGGPNAALAAPGPGEDGAPEEEIEEDIEDSVEEDVEDELESDVEDQVEADIEDDVEGDIEASVEADIEDDVEGDIEASVEDDVEDSVEDDVEGDVESDIEDDVEDDVEDGIEDDVEDDAESDVESRVEDKVNDKVDSKIDDISEAGKAVEHDLEDSLENQLESNFDNSGNDEDPVEDEEDEHDDDDESTSGSSNPGSGNAEDDDEDEDDEDDENDDDSENEGDEEGGEDGDDGEGADDDDESGKPGKTSSSSGSKAGLSNFSTLDDDRIFAVDFDEAGNEIVRREWLLLVSPDTIDTLSAKGFATERMESLDGLGLVLVRIKTTDRFTIDEPEAAIMEAAPDAKVDYNHVYFQHNYRTASKSTHAEQRGGATPQELLDLPTVGGGKGRSIGIIDTSIDVQHTSLKNAQIQVEDFVPYEYVRPETHGTSVVSILAGESNAYHGLLPQADVYAASVFFNSPTGVETATTFSLVRALDWMTKNNVSVVNMSLTGPANAILKSAIDSAYDKGTIVVAAVGNEGPNAAPLYPAAYNNVVAVTAVTRKKKIYRLANRGDYLDFAAPGVNVKHAADHGGFASSSGTSIAAPFVTAVLALSVNEESHITEEQLNALAVKAEDLGRKGFDPVYGYGLIRPLGD